MPTFYIRTYGCQMNERDSEALACLLRGRGYEETSREQDADVLLFNTCSVREQAERKVLGKVGLLKRLKRERPDIIIGVIGCMAQNYGRSLLDKVPHVDLVAGTDQLHQIADMIDDARQGHHGLVQVQRDSDISRVPRGHTEGQVSAFVSVMRGCNQFCSYCIVPYTRGRERSRPVEDVVREVEELANRGTREVVLLGQNITAYGVAEARKDGSYGPHVSPFAELLRAVHNVEAIRRIRFLSPHVRFMNEAFIEAVCTLPKVCNSLHIPVQSGSNRILEAMRRGYAAEDVLRVTDALRERQPEMTFSTDIIVGFPSETEEDFAATREVMRRMRVDMAYIFRYSPRSGTKAAENLEDSVPEAVKHQRNQVLLADLAAGAEQRNRAYLGSSIEVLVEGPSKRNPARWQGRTETNKVVIFPPEHGVREGDIIPVSVQRVTANSLFGTLVSS